MEKLKFYVWVPVHSSCLGSVWTHSPIQHSSLAQGDVFTTSGGSTPTLRHNTSATLTVFIWERAQSTDTGHSIILTSLISAQIKTDWWIH